MRLGRSGGAGANLCKARFIFGVRAVPCVELFLRVNALLNAVARVHATLANRLKRIPSSLGCVFQIIEHARTGMVLNSLFQLFTCFIIGLLSGLLCRGHLGLKLADVVYKYCNGGSTVVEE